MRTAQSVLLAGQLAMTVYFGGEPAAALGRFLAGVVEKALARRRR